MAGSAPSRTLNVQSFPRPPLVERCNRHIQIMWHGALIADCPAGEAYWVLETHHAPSPSTLSHPPSPPLNVPAFPPLDIHPRRGHARIDPFGRARRLAHVTRNPIQNPAANTLRMESLSHIPTIIPFSCHPICHSVPAHQHKLRLS